MTNFGLNYVAPWITLFADSGDTNHPITDLSMSWAGTNSIYADDTSFPLGALSFTCDTNRIKASFNKSIWLNGYGYGEGATIRSITSNPGGKYGVTADMGQVDYNYQYVFPPLEFIDHVDLGFSLDITTGTETLPPLTVHSLEGQFAVGDLFPGFIGNAREMAAMIAQAYGLDANDYAGWIGLTPLSITYDDPMPNLSGLQGTIDRGEPARYIEVNWYEGSGGTDIEVVPADAPVISVDAGEVVVTDIAVNAWLKTVNQPEATDRVEFDADYYNGTDGVYAVAGNDNVPIQPDQWLNNGGSVFVEVAPEDPRILRVTVRGMDSRPDLAPFRIAMTSTDFYPALRVTGTAVTSNQRTVRVPTGVDEAITQTEVGVTIDNPFIQTLDQAYTVGTRVAKRYTGIVLTLDGSSEYIDPVGNGVLHEDTKYRIRSASSGAQLTDSSWQAEDSTTMGDFEEVWTVADTMQDFEDEWDGATMGDYMLAVLRRD